ncbi:MAG: kelch repeat-containing protein [Phycisphaerales bacterium]
MLGQTLAVMAIGSTLAAGTPVWEPGPPLPAGLGESVHAVGLNQNGALYAIGGPPWRNGGDEDGSVHRLALGATSWVEVAALDGIGPFIFQGGGVDAMGQLIIFGGEFIEDPEESPQSPFVYEPVDGPGGGLADRSAAAAFARFGWCTDDAGRIYSLGGGLGADGANTGHCERYDSSLDAWEAIAPMPTPAADVAAACDGDRVLVFGGFTEDGGARSANVAVYDIATDTWSDTAAPDMPVALTGARAVVGSDGRFYVLGGVSGPVGSGVVQSTVWVLESDLSSWFAGPPMSEARRWFAATMGSDDRIYVVGGDNDAGGTTGVETLLTIPCPEFVEHPVDQQAWAGSVAGFSALAVGGGTITYQWFKDGDPLLDGPTGTGSEIVGATTHSLGILNPSDADEGAFTVQASNSCGMTQAMGEGVLVVSAPTSLGPGWDVVNLHPAWATSSTAAGIDRGVVAGSATTIHPTYGALSQAALWLNDSPAAFNMTPGNSVGSEVRDFANDVAVGWYWRPYSCQGGTCYFKVAAKWTWNGASWSHTDIHSYPEYDYAVATDGSTHVGYSWSDEPSYTSRRVVWYPTGGYGTFDGAGAAVADGVAYGAFNDGAATQAAKWRFQPTVRTMMAPPGASASSISGAGDHQQVGSATVGSSTAWLWAGSGGGSKSMQPAAATGASLRDCEQGLQVGSVTIDGVGAAAIWSGDAESFVDLGALAPGSFTTTIATAVDAESPDGRVRVVGYGYNATNGRFEALMWINAPISCPGDANGDGAVDFDDLNLVLSNWSSAGPAGDVDGSGFVDFADLNIVLAGWGLPCP